MSANQQARRECEQFDARGVGQEVIVTLGSVRVRTRTRSAAVAVAHRYAAVEVKGVSGLHLLSNVEQVTERTNVLDAMTPEELIEANRLAAVG